MTLLGLPHHDGSPLHVSNPTPSLGDVVTVWVRTPSSAGVETVYVRSTPDAEPRMSAARRDRVQNGETWWRAEVTVRNPVTKYRFYVDGPGGPRWLNARGVCGRDVPDTHDFRLVAWDPPPARSLDDVVYQIFPDRFARSGSVDGPAPDWAIPCDWDTPVIGRGP